MTDAPPETCDRPAGLLRTVAALVYDALAVIAIWMICTFAVLFLTGGEAVTTGNALYQCLLVILAWCYAGWSWIATGQTLGMRPWKLKLVTTAGTRPGLKHVLARFPAALVSALACGLGYIWMLIPPHRCSWHDRLSGTRLIIRTDERGNQRPRDNR